MSMVNETRALVEITPRYPTRMVYNKTLYPNGFAYFKRMTARKALAALLTCKAIKVVDEKNEKYYPVNRQNIYEVFDAVMAGETPAVTAVDPGVHTIASYFNVQDDVTAKADGIAVGKLCDVMHENLYLYGDVFYKENFTDFDTNKKYQSGWYIVLTWTENDELSNPTIEIVNEADSVNEKGLEENTVIWLGNTKEAAIRTIIKITAEDKEGNAQEAFVYCKHLHLIDGPTHYLDAPTAAGGSDDKKPSEGGENQGGGGSEQEPTQPVG